MHIDTKMRFIGRDMCLDPASFGAGDVDGTAEFGREGEVQGKEASRPGRPKTRSLQEPASELRLPVVAEEGAGWGALSGLAAAFVFVAVVVVVGAIVIANVT
mmetsp:Transcript_10697/g.16050  ORF Transcript_10697/g.16050 Transcript_10697/m.16050 type:complete len:102 (-) Transcript_10697:61-366(-)